MARKKTTKVRAVRRMTMPRRRVRYVTRVRRAYRRASGFGGGIVNNLIAGAIAGAACRFVGGTHPLASPAATAGVGWFMKNSTLQTIGGMQLGQMLVGGFGGSATTGGGWY